VIDEMSYRSVTYRLVERFAKKNNPYSENFCNGRTSGGKTFWQNLLPVYLSKSLVRNGRDFLRAPMRILLVSVAIVLGTEDPEVALVIAAPCILRLDMIHLQEVL
jgi:hypothetical protein